MSFSEDDFLQLSGIQHFAFCRRQWALIHIECQWAENLRTTEGELMHERAHDTTVRERRGSIITVRGMSVHSSTMGVSGKCDVVEFHADSGGVPLMDAEGLWLPYPVEYKRGVPKEGQEDRLQLCAQAMCLEEMLCYEVPEGAQFYGESRHREIVTFSEELRKAVRDSLAPQSLPARGGWIEMERSNSVDRLLSSLPAREGGLK